MENLNAVFINEGLPQERKSQLADKAGATTYRT